MKFNKKAILAALGSLVIGSSVVAECSNGAKIRWEPAPVATADSSAA